MTSKVYFMDARSDSADTSLIAKTLTVFDAAGLDKLIHKDDVVAIKVHCGEWNSSAYLRPVYARALADRIKELGGRPFVCDTTTQTYNPYGSRATELDLLETASRNGFNALTLGCPFICADGYVGTSDYRVDIPEGYILKEAFVAQAIAAADVLITLTHFKGHGIGVIGGALKNLGIGAQSKRGKFNVHMGRHPKYGIGDSVEFHPENFLGKEKDPDWTILEDCCPLSLFEVTDNDELKWDREKCINCLGCMGIMNPRGIFRPNLANFDATDAAIADGALGVVKAVGGATGARAGARSQCSTDGGERPHWRDDGLEIVYIDPERRLMAVTVEESDGKLSLGTPRELFTFDDPVQAGDATGAHLRFLVANREEAQSGPLYVILDWPADH